MKRNLASKTLVVLGIVLALTACPDTTSFNSGLDVTRKTTALSESEGRKYCTDLATHFQETGANDGIHKLLCVASGQEAGGSGELACRNCMLLAPSQTRQSAGCSGGEYVKSAFASCNATVGELNGCVDALVKNFTSFEMGLTCGSVVDVAALVAEPEPCA